ncbi:hypothetical protein LK07_02935 [Streptomyces pluripotens]|uniref:Uncharacterized protein n=2 Tax=Streptomyces pluripotens TaxID=1355015 RepID=A0A221NUD9_9ACTN|nr:hypothetical protein [Streptomyces sp. MUM 16J]ARP68902.1 hypothetical protein LK06_001855 [Streptomyces pluripotens]ASN23155.1 hypothetical protein LK07_02935 [Streptomyces pluripotens]MCH0556885.1 hypothetical protein [Streptomyces sp. MUM 16J]
MTRHAVKDFKVTAGWLKDTRADRKNVAEAKRLLGFQQRDGSVYRNDNVHPLYNGAASIHPDNRRALLAAAGDDYLEAVRQGSLEILPRVEARLDDSLVLVGSPTSEGISRLIFGYTEAMDVEDSLILDTPPLDLPFRLILDRSQIPERALARRFVEDRGATARPNWRIESESRAFIPELGEDGWLRTDYLLVTRLRNFLTADGFAQGHSLVSVAGTHGVGTRALSLLLRDRALLKEIAAVTGRHENPSFQALFRISDIKHDPKAGSRGRRIELVQKPVVIGDSPQQWQEAGRQASHTVQRWLASDTNAD